MLPTTYYDTCQECGTLMERKPKGRPKLFCTTKCRAAFHRRRRDRGQELYDFVMEWRFVRDTPDMMAQIARLASAYRDADNAKRAGRASWNAQEAQMRLPLAYGKDGDRR